MVTSNGLPSTRSARTAVHAALALFGLVGGLWPTATYAVFVRHDLAMIGTAGVGLDDYEARGALYPATGYLWNSNLNGGAGGEWCTGTIINYTNGVTTILTAAHCVAPFDTNPALDRNGFHHITAAEAAPLSFQLGMNGNLNGAGVAVNHIWYPNTFTVVGNPDDVAIIEVTGTQATFGVAAQAFSFTTPAAVLGSQADFVGWGNQGTGLAAGAGGPPSSVTDPFGYTARDKLGGQNIIDSMWNGMLVTDFDDTGNADGINPLGGAFPLNLEGTTAQGDSGGPLLPVGANPGAGTVIGVLSAGVLGPNANCVSSSLYNDCSAWAPLSANQNFINTYVPEPSTATLLGIVLTGSLVVRRRRNACQR